MRQLGDFFLRSKLVNMLADQGSDNDRSGKPIQLVNGLQIRPIPEAEMKRVFLEIGFHFFISGFIYGSLDCVLNDSDHGQHGDKDDDKDGGNNCHVGWQRPHSGNRPSLENR